MRNDLRAFLLVKDEVFSRRWNWIFNSGLSGISENRNGGSAYKATFVIQFGMKRLSDLKAGSTAKILSFEDNDLFLKLMEMGCVPGEDITVEQIAPLGDPISITVSGYSLSLRINEADNIFVEEKNK